MPKIVHAALAATVAFATTVAVAPPSAATLRHASAVYDCRPNAGASVLVKFSRDDVSLLLRVTVPLTFISPLLPPGTVTGELLGNQINLANPIIIPPGPQASFTLSKANSVGVPSPVPNLKFDLLGVTVTCTRISDVGFPI